jgi:hypothetical protein
VRSDRIFLKRIDRVTDAGQPTGGLIGGTIVSPPFERRMNVLFGGFGDSYPEHRGKGSDSILLAELSFKVSEIAHSARGQRIETFLHGTALLIQPVEGIEGSPDYIRLGDTVAYVGSLPDPIKYVLWQIDFHT